MPLSPGTTLGPYAVTAKIGEGGMGEVYQARDTKLDRDVALKVLPDAVPCDRQTLRPLRQRGGSGRDHVVAGDCRSLGQPLKQRGREQLTTGPVSLTRGGRQPTQDKQVFVPRRFRAAW